MTLGCQTFRVEARAIVQPKAYRRIAHRYELLGLQVKAHHVLYVDLMPASLTFHGMGFQLYAGPYVSALLNANVQRMDENGRMFKDKVFMATPENDETTESRYLQKIRFRANVDWNIALTSAYP